MRRLLVTVAMATIPVLLIASPANAAVPLNPSHVNATAPGFGPSDCGGGFQTMTPPIVLPAEEGWHFVLPASASEDFVSVTVTFNTPAPVSVTITSVNPAAPTLSSGARGYIENAGEADKHMYLITPAGWTLTGGSAITDPPSDTGNFNLSHTCYGGASPSPSPSPVPSPTPSPSPPPTPGPSSSVTPSMPTVVPSGGADTGAGGSQGIALAGVGALAIAGGVGVVLFLIRRRDRIA